MNRININSIKNIKKALSTHLRFATPKPIALTIHNRKGIVSFWSFSKKKYVTSLIQPKGAR